MSVVSSCGERPAKAVFAQRDTTITQQTSFSKLFFDSADLEKFISHANISKNHRQQISDFYKRRNYQYAWFTEAGVAEHTRSFWNLHNSYIDVFQDSALKSQALHTQIDKLLEPDIKIDSASMRELEWQFTLHFFEFSSHAYAGQLDPAKLQWYIPKKKINQGDLLDSLIGRKGKDLEEWEPVNRLYRQLKNALIRYRAVSEAGGWKEIPFKNEKYKLGDTAKVLKLVKQRLRATGEYGADSTPYFSDTLLQAVKASQKRFGLAETGIVTSAFIKELNVPVDTRIRQILINLERMRWVPEPPKGSFIVVNIPEYRLHVVEDNARVFSMKIVVGKAAHNTVIFTGKIKFVVFSPYWNVPPSIVRNEVLPAIRRNPNYLARMNMETTGEAGGLPVIRQRPGGGNALGKVKFIFPNSYNIYLHDTPAKSLFKEQNRAFSHGCIRISEPERLAAYLLRNQPEWTEEKRNAAMSAGVEKWVNLKDPVPVMITYFTAWANTDGFVSFRKDVYGHDLRLSKSLFKAN